MKIYLATGNRHKLDELAPMFPGHQIVLPADEGIPFAFEENGTTYFENCFGKARTLFDAVRAPVLADDSGLSVFCLGGAPGIYSARYGAPPEFTLPDTERKTAAGQAAIKSTVF